MSCVVLSASLREPARGTILYNIHYAIQQDEHAAHRECDGEKFATSTRLGSRGPTPFSAHHGPSAHARTFRAASF
ncbi:hypothetical protein DN523_19335 [Burkholderia multivorans]|nr:hypothetical protein BURMUCF2_B0447 [Burkholderia multivorans CF2]PRH47607.1 hypothetical protein C6V05_15650 [Burkholderia multivorans]RAA23285.1 hypothetical protein DN470_20565 [Burkholderia multivorans]RAA30728.1 hypothetical protein DN465_21120 [Burkholderia multivorans]RAA34090.1 hypothetical protein DN471_00065 [Burkholderia multivorans]